MYSVGSAADRLVYTVEALTNLKHSIAVVQLRWDKINQICEQKCTRLSDSLEACKENEKMLSELTAWLQVAEATLSFPSLDFFQEITK